jgi:excisionase family DNA binding protein
MPLTRGTNRPNVAGNGHGGTQLPERLVYSVDEVAEQVGLSSKQVLRLVGNGTITPTYVRGCLRISRDQLDRLAETRTVDTDPSDDLVRVGEAAEMLGVSPRTAWRMVKAGDLPTVKLGPRATRVRVSDVRSLVA